MEKSENGKIGKWKKRKMEKSKRKNGQKKGVELSPRLSLSLSFL